jgi:hypothetical protein
VQRSEILDLPRLLAARLAGKGLNAEVLDVGGDVYGVRLDPAARFFVEELFPGGS